METLERILAKHSFFEGVDPHYLQFLVGCASNVRFDVGQTIFRQGEEAEQFYLIRHGRVELQLHSVERGRTTIQTLGEGDILGWSWLVSPYHWHFDARATELTRALALDGKCLRTKCEDDHKLGYELLKRFVPVIVRRLDATCLQLLDIYGTRS
jgi:CRP-like cAMP-binding protein